jgi:hypothetical protein
LVREIGRGERRQVEVQIVHSGTSVIAIGLVGEVGEIDEVSHPLLQRDVFGGDGCRLIRQDLLDGGVHVDVLMLGMLDEELHKIMDLRGMGDAGGVVARVEPAGLGDGIEQGDADGLVNVAVEVERNGGVG